jgi:hypothetical protein
MAHVVKVVNIVTSYHDTWLYVYLFLQTFIALSGPRWPTYKVYGNPPPVALEACATNLHTSVLDVITSGASSPPISPTSPFEESVNTSAIGNGLAALKSHTGYCISTMAVPTVDDKLVTVSTVSKNLYFTGENIAIYDMLFVHRATVTC